MSALIGRHDGGPLRWRDTLGSSIFRFVWAATAFVTRERHPKGSKSMIYHGNRFTIKPGVSSEQLEEALESLRNRGGQIASVQHFTSDPTSAANTTTARSTSSTI
ncbi:hypothetical protein ACIP5Y_26425 [Nocardia sp. NPDC088792]|uniref:hypothetical protein n=1 Tax=Nocardia sp. NPDC088792 TaxID=3364332 RepID=UPI0037FE2E58